MGGYSCPDINKEFLGLFAFEKPGISVAVVNVVSGLSSRAIVHIENQVESGITAPFHEGIYPLKSVLCRHQAHIILVSEEFVIERQPDGIGTAGCYEAYVLFCNIIILEFFPEFCRLVRPHELAEHVIDHPGRIGLGKTEHIAFRVKPVSKVGASYFKFASVRTAQVGAVDDNESGFWGTGIEKAKKSTDNQENTKDS